ncbi:hypothetical protein AMR41_23310 [Hapalosiphon sp. MRB220]|nr:hypothetical protein AMR41_23310 [Hapalosiphon sp. MRB220]
MQVSAILQVHWRKRVDFTSREYSYKGLRFRAYCDKNGKNGRLVLEDIVSILLELSNDNRNPEEVTHEKLQQIKIETTEYDGFHLVSADSMLDFYLECDDISNANDSTEFGELAELLAGRITEILEKDLVILGKTAFLIPEWRKAAIQITNEYWNEVVNESGKINLRNWLERTYKLEIYFVLYWVVIKFRNVISPTFRAASGTRPVKDESKNIFEPHEFAIIEPLITDYLSNTNGEWQDDIKKKADTEKSENFKKTKQNIGILKAQGKSNEEIIYELFNVTQDSHIVEKYRRNYLYDSLDIFINCIPKSK